MKRKIPTIYYYKEIKKCKFHLIRHTSKGVVLIKFNSIIIQR